MQPNDKLQQFQTIARIVEAINKARSSVPGKVVAARHVRSGDVLVTADSLSTKNHLEEETRWMTVIAGHSKM